MADPYIGEIRLFGGNFAMAGWALCNGQTLAISTNVALFSIIGTYYGGNGTTTFQLPNLQGRVPIGMGSGAGLSTYTIGQTGGTESTALTIANLAAHSHTVNASNTAGGSSQPAANLLGAIQPGARPEYYVSGTAPDTSMNPLMIAQTGSSAPFNIVQPFLAITFLIALVGIFPSRN
jgi:microcystin-dependent protein